MFNGTKIMYMHIERGLDIHIIDSLNFLPMHLASLTKAFGLDEMKKGGFLTISILLKIEIMLIHTHVLKCMALILWHLRIGKLTLNGINHWRGGFNFCDELMSYCISDVNIL